MLFGRAFKEPGVFIILIRAHHIYVKSLQDLTYSSPKTSAEKI